MILTEQVRDRILSGDIPSDSWIKQDVLAAEYGLSKIPVRETLRQLELEGLVKSEPNRGFFVRPLLASEAEEIFDLRLQLEAVAVAAGASAATSEDRQIALAALDQLTESTSAHRESTPLFNRHFHMALVTPARRPVTTEMVERLHVMAERYTRKHLEPLERARRANDEHNAILKAWLDRDEAEVARLVHAHIAEARDELRVQLGAGKVQYQI